MEESSKQVFFISHHSEDSAMAEWIAWQLEAENHTCIIETWDFRPGSNSVLSTDAAIKLADRVIIVLSPDYLEAAQTQAEWAAIFVQDPVGTYKKLLPVQVRACNLEGFLAPIGRINLIGLDEKAAHKALLAGIRQERMKSLEAPRFPEQFAQFSSKSNILITSLGDSPAVISEMYDLLTKQEKLTIDRLVVLCPEGRDTELAYTLVRKALPGLEKDGKLVHVPLGFEDANDWRSACRFLKSLSNELRQYSEKDYSVYLSLAGGRKSMAALMAWVVPLFPCIERLYHVIDKEENTPHYFLPVRRMANLSNDIFARFMHPPLERLTLVDIPLEKVWQLSADHRAKLLVETPNELADNEYYEEKQAIAAFQNIFQPGNLLNIQVTKTAASQFRNFLAHDEATARLIMNHLFRMDNVVTLRRDVQRHEDEVVDCMIKTGQKSKKSVRLHYFKGFKEPAHLVFYTEPNDITEYPEQEVNQMVICALEMEGTEGYRTLQEVKAALKLSVVETDDMEVSLPTPSPVPIESVLIVPLGNTPMVATQLYTLLTRREKRTIREVVLIYPEESTLIQSGANIIKEILPVKVCYRVVPGRGDIDCKEACCEFQQILENEIDRVRRDYPLCKIDLALSGGRKGMTAMTIFAAQQRNIPFVYHTLIKDEALSEQINEETTIEALTDPDLTDQQLKDRLLLEDYRLPDELYPYSRFTLFRVPVVFPITD